VDIFVSRANTSIGQRSFTITAPDVWNAFPPELRSPHNSRRQFRSKQKTCLSRQAYNTTWFLWEQFVKECTFVTVTDDFVDKLVDRSPSSFTTFPPTQPDVVKQQINTSELHLNCEMLLTRLGSGSSFVRTADSFTSLQQHRQLPYTTLPPLMTSDFSLDCTPFSQQFSDPFWHADCLADWSQHVCVDLKQRHSVHNGNGDGSCRSHDGLCFW